jgi:hypothetical protein
MNTASYRLGGGWRPCPVCDLWTQHRVYGWRRVGSLIGAGMNERPCGRKHNNGRGCPVHDDGGWGRSRAVNVQQVAVCRTPVCTLSCVCLLFYAFFWRYLSRSLRRSRSPVTKTSSLYPKLRWRQEQKHSWIPTK